MKIGILSDIHAEPQALWCSCGYVHRWTACLRAADAVSGIRVLCRTRRILQQVNAQCIQGDHETVGGAQCGGSLKMSGRVCAGLPNVLATAPVRRARSRRVDTPLMVHASPWKPFEDYAPPRSPSSRASHSSPTTTPSLDIRMSPWSSVSTRVTVMNPGPCAQPRHQDRRRLCTSCHPAPGAPGSRAASSSVTLS